MKIISPALHGLLDYITALALLVLPFVFLKPGSVAAVFSIVAAILQFFLAMATRYRAGLFKFLSFRMHGYIEIGAAITMAIIAFEFLSIHLQRVFYYYLTAAVIYAAVFFLTDFRVPERDKKPIVLKMRERRAFRDPEI